MPEGMRGDGRARQALVAFALVVACLLSACAGSPSDSDKPAATSDPSTVPSLSTSASAPTATPIADPLSVCTNTPGSRVSIPRTHIGAQDGGWQALPANLTLKPQPGALALDHQQNATLALKGVTLWVGLGAPSTGSAGNVCAVTVEIVSYRPLSAPIPNVTRVCSDPPWANPGGVETGVDVER